MRGANAMEGLFVLEVASLSLSFGGLTVLNDVAFRARAGEVTALIGPNGAGKSALLNCVSGLYPTARGARILVDGVAIDHLAPHLRARAGLARTFQHLNLVPELSVLENVMTGLSPIMGDGLVGVLARPLRQQRRESERRARAHEALRQFELEPYADTPAGTLALGVQRRCDLARAVMCEPRVLLLDEPASGMSRSERRQIPEWIARLQSARQCAVVWIEHDVELLTSTAHAVFVLHHGEVTASGRPRDHEGDRDRVIDAYFGRKHEAVARAS